MGKKNPYDSKGTFGISEEERRARNAQLGRVNDVSRVGMDTARETAESVNPSLERFYSPDGMSTWKKGQIDTRTAGVNQSYNDALAANRLRARMAGFGYTQPVSASAETDIENARASDLARIKGDVEAEAVPIEMDAMRTRLASGSEEAGQYGNFGRLQLGVAGEYSPEQYYQTAAQQQEQEKARKGSLFGKLVKTGLSFIPGGGTFGKMTDKASGAWG